MGFPSKISGNSLIDYFDGKPGIGTVDEEQEIELEKGKQLAKKESGSNDCSTN